MNNKELANIIDHTLLKADATQAEIIKLFQIKFQN